MLGGTPRKGTAQPLTLALRVSDGSAVATRPTRLLVYQSDIPLTTPAWWKPALPPVPWRAWLDQGVGFLVLWLVHLVGMSALANLERGAGQPSVELGGAGRVHWLFTGASVLTASSFVSALYQRCWLSVRGSGPHTEPGIRLPLPRLGLYLLGNTFQTFSKKCGQPWGEKR